MGTLIKTIPIFFIAGLFMGSFGYAQTVKIIAEDGWYPYSGLTDEGVKGIGVDIAREAFKAEGIDVEFEAMNYDRGMLLVKDGEAIGCFNTPWTKEIEDIYLWHDEPMYAAKSFFYASADFEGQINSVKDLNGQTLGLTQGYGYGNSIDMNNDINKEYSKTDEIVIRKLIAKRVDVTILYDRVADHLMSNLQLQGKIKSVGSSEATDIYIAFSKKHPDGKKYRDLFSSGFRKIKENGTYQKIFEDWDSKLKPSIP